MYGLVLSGGGARGAYQAGVMRAFFDICLKHSIKFPFKVYSGVSAGAINAGMYASYADTPALGIDNALSLWSNLNAGQVFKTDFLSLSKSSLAWISDLSFGSLYKTHMANSLLNTDPLRELIKKEIPLQRVTDHLKNGHLNSLAITATSYQSSYCINFIQGIQDFPLWVRTKREAQMAELTIDHLMASSAIPVFFPPIQIGEHYYGDGCLRNTAPVSPAIHLGANKLFIIGVRSQKLIAHSATQEREAPSIAKILSTVMNAVFLDGIDMDIERLSRINKTLSSMPEKSLENTPLRPVEFLWISPSKDLSTLALKHSHRMAKGIRYLLGGLGSLEDCADILSYLLFDHEYCQEVIELGHSDGMKREDDILKFLTSDASGIK